MKHAEQTIPVTKPLTFYAIGISYKKADAIMRGKFSLDENAKLNLLQQVKKDGISQMFLISTCNRTEIFGFAEHPFQLIKPLCDNSIGTVAEFQEYAYIYKGNEALNHLFRVGTGLDSQILGDFEIISQIKTGFIQSKKIGITNAYLERLVNAVIQASKRVKTETEISSGATSVSFAAVQYILKNTEDVGNKNILLFGAGKIGRNTCENLVKHSKHNHITLVNRTKDKAEKLAKKLNLIVKDYSDLETEIYKADILVVATGAQKPTVDASILNLKKPLLILDLSIPKNVNDNVTNLPNVTLVHLDHLSQITDETLENRKQYIPAAENIIQEILQDFIIWTKGRKFAPTIHALQIKLKAIKHSEIKNYKKKVNNLNEEHANEIANKVIQKITNHFANHLKDNETPMEESIAMITKIFQLENHG
jgi:glutamyl-tRNA reductase